eukprot:TRINITY_DN1730_c0_g2_i1.p1 TRINITY_DN1730_c0_g2~~TRINITY_DN1730_c0_g2_i1.p1  ORF type:complete len:251 (+),score=94.62 TRINITY_DN1730_c0_g2_i1:84-836(+)
MAFEERRIAVTPPEFSYYLNELSVVQKKTWEGTPVAILAVSNPSNRDIAVKVRVNHLQFLVRPPRFKLPAGCEYQPLIVRLSPDFSEVKMMLCEDKPGNTMDETSAKLILKKVEPNELPACIAVSQARRGNTIFHSKDLTEDQVRVALDRTGIYSVAADFIKRGISFKKLCALVWGCCLQVRPTAPHDGFLHESNCPLVTMRDKVKLTSEGMNCKQCPLCGAERTMIQQGEGGITFDLINIVIQYIDPLI